MIKNSTFKQNIRRFIIPISDAGTGGPGGPLPPPQYLVDKLTLLKPGRSDYPHLLVTTGIPNVFHLPASLSICHKHVEQLRSIFDCCRVGYKVQFLR